MKNIAIPAAIRGRKNRDGKYVQRLEPHDPGCANTITTVQKDNVIITGKTLKELTRPVSHCIEASYFHGVTLRKNTGLPRRQMVLKDSHVRRLTPLECWRLMGFDDTDIGKARAALNDRFHKGKDRADSQLYKQAGNSVVVDVLVHIMENLHSSMPYLFENMTVGSFFSGIGAFEKALMRLEDAA